MGFFDKLFGNDEDERRERQSQPQLRQQSGDLSAAPQSADEQAIARYRYLLRTAPPETIEQAHAEAFARLTPQQRQMVLQGIAAELPEAERRFAATGGDDPQTLARLATRAEVRQPGTIERISGGGFGGMGGGGFGGGFGLGGMLAGSFLSSLAGSVIGGYIAEQFFDNDPNYLAGNFEGAPENFAANDYQNFGENDFQSATADYPVEADDVGGIGDFAVDANEDFGDWGGDFSDGDF